MSETGRRERSTMQLAAALLLFVALVYAFTFFKLPVWLPALQ